MSMTPMQRTLAALGHREPDRVPLFMLLTEHGARELGISIEAYFSCAQNVIEGQLRLHRKYRTDCLYAFYYAAILIIGGAGGVGSIAVQIARQFTSLTVIATASRPETRDFVASLGAHHVVDHSKPIAGQVAALGIGAPAFVFSTTQTAKHIDDIAELIAPQGRLCLIDDPSGFDIMKFKRKAVSIHHELMFTRSIFQTPDMDEQGRILNEMSSAVDDGKIRSTAMQNLGSINAQNLKKAHAQLESGTTIGKVVLEGFA